MKHFYKSKNQWSISVSLRTNDLQLYHPNIQAVFFKNFTSLLKRPEILKLPVII